MFYSEGLFANVADIAVQGRRLSYICGNCIQVLALPLKTKRKQSANLWSPTDDFSEKWILYSLGRFHTAEATGMMNFECLDTREASDKLIFTAERLLIKLNLNDKET